MKTRNKSNRATIVDVAQRAGVSTMTVTRVIHKRDVVSDATREKVEDAIRSLGYAPNLAARALVGMKVRRVCLLYGNPSAAYLGELLVGALKAARVAQVQLVLEQTDGDFEPEALIAKFNQDWDALIVPPPMSDSAALRKLVDAQNIPAVFLSSATPDLEINEVRIDDYEAAFDMTAFLLKAGHRRIGFIQGDPSQTVSARRYEGYRDALGQAGIEVASEYVEAGLFTYKSGLTASRTLLTLSPRPTAIFASNDDMAAGVMATAMQMGIAIPSELAIVGFDDSPIASTVSPALTTMRQPVAEMAELAVELVLRHSEVKAGEKVVLSPHQLVERETT